MQQAAPLFGDPALRRLEHLGLQVEANTLDDRTVDALLLLRALVGHSRGVHSRRSGRSPPSEE